METENDCCICLEQIDYCPISISDWTCTHYNCICIGCYNKITHNEANSKCLKCRSHLSNINQSHTITNNNSVNLQSQNNLNQYLNSQNLIGIRTTFNNLDFIDQAYVRNPNNFELMITNYLNKDFMSEYLRNPNKINQLLHFMNNENTYDNF